MSTQKQFAANQANAQHSTGPTSDAGKATSSLNAVKSGLTGLTILLPSDDVALYEAHVAAVTGQYQPAGPAEQALVQSIADAEWRLRRIPVLEYGLYAMGHTEFAPLYANEPEHKRATLILTKTYLAYEKQIKNLHLQETRIRRHRDHDLNELEDLRQARQAQEKYNDDLQQADDQKLRFQQGLMAADSLIEALKAGKGEQWQPVGFGFDFSFNEILGHLNNLAPEVVDEYEALLEKRYQAERALNPLGPRP